MLQQHHRVACAGQKPHCCAQTWRGSSLPTKRHGAKTVFLKEGEGWSTGPSCCIVLSSSGVANLQLAVNLSVCLHCISPGLRSLLLNFSQTHCVLSHFDEFFVCEDGSEGPTWAHPSHKVCTLLLQNLMAQCETGGQISHSEPQFFYFVAAQHLQATATRGQYGSTHCIDQRVPPSAF